MVEVAAKLAEGPLKGLRVGILHGRMAPEEKDAVMRAYSAAELDVLVATTVIEVGVNVPNSTVIVVLDADRFGVSQLHQLRGRVGRGSAAGLCLLVTESPEGSPARERLAAVASTLDGFELSKIDLELRKEGDVLGAAQSGYRSSLRLLSVIADEDVIRAAREEATPIVEADASLAGHPRWRARSRGCWTPSARNTWARHDRVLLPGADAVTRIIAGAAKGRRLAVPPGDGTRPTVRPGARGVVLRAGLRARRLRRTGRPGPVRRLRRAGAGGAVARAPARVVLVEADRRAAGVIRRNVAVVDQGTRDVQVVTDRAERYVEGEPPGLFDVVLLDPPYAVGDADVTKILSGSRRPAAGWPTRRPGAGTQFSRLRFRLAGGL